jgi:hypothetical protein
MPLRSFLCCLAFAVALAPFSLSAKPSLAGSANIARLKNNPIVQTAIKTCRNDAAALCAGVIPGGGRILKCLACQSANLTPSCKTALNNARDTLIKSGAIPPTTKLIQ